MGIAAALVLAAAFGAGDQYLGSLAGSGHAWAGGWAVDVSLLSAPWLVVGFVAGATRREPRRAALLGLACTFAAILGYFLLTDSPLEGAHYSLAGVRTFVISDPALLVGGLVTGPLFDWFGQQWRTRRALLGALLTAAALCLEPLARRVPLAPMRYHVAFAITPIRSHTIVVAEVAAGIALAVYTAAGAIRSRGHG